MISQEFVDIFLGVGMELKFKITAGKCVGTSGSEKSYHVKNLQTEDGMPGRSSEEAGTRVTELFPNDEFCQNERLALYSQILCLGYICTTT